MLKAAEVVFASDLTLVECDRAIMREETAERFSLLEAAERRAILARASSKWVRLRLDEEVVERARQRFPHEPVRALDALHLSSALLAARSARGLSVLSLDDRVRRAGAAMGFPLLP